MNGVAYTTSGAYSVRRAGASGLTTPDREGWPGRFPGAGDRPGHGLRAAPVAGDGQEDRRRRQRSLARTASWPMSCGGSTAVGPAEIMVGESCESVPGGSDCWVRENSYLQHGEKGEVMDSIEVFTVEETYGNTVFTDELMTGRRG